MQEEQPGILLNAITLERDRDMRDDPFHCQHYDTELHLTSHVRQPGARAQVHTCRHACPRISRLES